MHAPHWQTHATIGTGRAWLQVTIGDGSSLTQLLVGSPATGEVNGVNIVALANSAVKNSGDQTIAGECVARGLLFTAVSKVGKRLGGAEVEVS
jgi:hypothetical protein